jgi:N-glycosylase/DNA lyase
MLNKLNNSYEEKKDLIKKRLEEFKQTYQNEEKIFEELAFCIFAANSSAKMGLKAVELLRPVINGSLDDYKRAVFKRVRFYNLRANYLFDNKRFKGNFRKILNNENIRDFLVENIKGFGLKEASHFLRNIGFSGYCILDKHIINSLFELGVFPDNKPPKNREEYLEKEELMKEFAKKINIPVDDLDLLLWSNKTGEVLK